MVDGVALDLLGDWLDATLGPARAGSTREARLEEGRRVADAARPRVAGLRDPFLPVARGDASARARETVLWEDARVLVLVDTFWSSPKLLVIPKQELLFPVDAPAEVLTRLSQVCRAVVDAFRAVAGGTPARCWINPPDGISVRQLHVHVMPGLSTPGGARGPDAQKLYAGVAAELARTLDG